MKKFLLTFSAAALMVLFSATATAQSANKAIAKAKSQCGNLYHGQNVTWVASPIIFGRCAEPTGHEFVVYEVKVVFSCPPQVLTQCLPAPPVVIANVTWDCQGDITVDCQ